MKENQNKIWSKIKSRVQSHVPDDYSNEDWAAMEDLLNAELTEKSPWRMLFTRKNFVLLIALFFTVGLWSLSWLDKTFFSNDREEGMITITALPIPQLLELQSTTINEFGNGAAIKNKKPTIDLHPMQTNVPNANHLLSQENRNTTEGSEKKLVEFSLAKAKRKQVRTTDTNDLANGDQNLQNSRIMPSIVGEMTANLQQYIKREDESVPSGMTNNSIEDLLPLPLLSYPLLASMGTIPSLPSVKEVSYFNLPNRLALGKWRFGASIGLSTVMTDYENGSISILPHLGGFISKVLHERLELQLEVQLKNVANYGVSQTYEEEVFSPSGDTGFARVVQTYKSYSSIEIPLIIKYAIFNRVGLLGGVRYSRIRTSLPETNISVVGITQYIPPIYTRIPQKGFWEHDFGMVLGLEAYLNPKWRLDVRYNQGFKDITPDNLYKDAKIHLNSDLQISIHRIF